MTKRKHAARTATDTTPSARSAKVISPNLLYLDSSANPSTERKANISTQSNTSAVSEQIASEDVGIDDIFQQACNKKKAPVKTEKVCVPMFGKYRLAMLEGNSCICSNAFLAQKPKAVSKAPRVVGSKDDIFGTGQPKQRRYHFPSHVHCVKVLSSITSNSTAQVIIIIVTPCCRYDAEGLPVYTPEELNVGAGGETDQCPFDCNCCY